MYWCTLYIIICLQKKKYSIRQNSDKKETAICGKCEQRAKLQKYDSLLKLISIMIVRL